MKRLAVLLIAVLALAGCFDPATQRILEDMPKPRSRGMAELPPRAVALLDQLQLDASFKKSPNTADTWRIFIGTERPGVLYWGELGPKEKPIEVYLYGDSEAAVARAKRATVIATLVNRDDDMRIVGELPMWYSLDHGHWTSWEGKLIRSMEEHPPQWPTTAATAPATRP